MSGFFKIHLFLAPLPGSSLCSAEFFCLNIQSNPLQGTRHNPYITLETQSGPLCVPLLLPLPCPPQTRVAMPAHAHTFKQDRELVVPFQIVTEVLDPT